MRRRVTRRQATAALAVGVLVVSLSSSLPAFGDQAGLPVVTDYEGTLPITTTSPGIFPFGNDTASNPTLTQVSAPDVPGASGDNHALDVKYKISAYGGYSHNFSASEDWTAFGGFSFWVKGSSTGNKIQFEIKDGGTDGEHSELFEGFFTDDSSTWKQVKLPFTEFVKRTSYQPSPAPTDGNLDLTNMWGFSLNIPPGEGTFDIDNVVLFGTASPRASVVKDAFVTDPGGTVQVPVTATQPGGGPLANDVTVSYKIGGGTAQPGTDYTATDGSVTFPAGTASGTVKTIEVKTLPSTAASVGKTIPVKITATGAAVTASEATVVINAHGLPYLDPKLPVATRVADLMSRMSVADKVGQMTQAERNAVGTGSEIVKYRLGSLLSGGGSVPTPNTPEAWADMIDNFQLHAAATPLQIPLIYGIDSVHGDNNLLGATVFPHNIGMGATRDPALVKEDGRITATETRATGVPWAFSPCLCVARDDRWGRTYESFSEDPALVSQLETIIDGLQNGGNVASNTAVLATAKHFFGDGGTTYGSSTTGSYKLDQGVTSGTQAELDAIHLAPFKTAVAKDVRTVMPSYSSLQIVGKDTKPIKMHARADQITGTLKGKLGFKGFVISDWAAIDQIEPDYKTDVKIGVNAGIDMVMVPTKIADFTQFLTELVASGDVPQARIDDAVSRILTQKFDLGLFEKATADRTHIKEIGSAAHRAVARQAAAESQVLLKNTGVLPLKKNAKVYVAGSAADDLGNQTGGWTLSWQGQSGNGPVGTSILAGVKQVAPGATVTYSKDASAPVKGSDVGLVVVGETPYAEGVGDVGNGKTLQLSTADRTAVDTVCKATKCVVLVISGRPLDITGIAPEAKAIVAGFLPGTEGAGVADVLFGAKPFTGRLPMTWIKAESQEPLNVGDKGYLPLFPYGWGLRTDSTKARLTAVRDQLAKGDAQAKAAATALTKALAAANWNANGSAKNGKAVLAALKTAGTALDKSAKDTFAQRDAVGSAARDVVQQAAIAKGGGSVTKVAKATSDAEHALMSDQVAQAVTLFTQAFGSL
ncbi:MAG: beta-glucosidase [Cryptosporangiaceae bacterium]|nr:beta-glucosidase [Cryptosporangiaceae bacterium]